MTPEKRLWQTVVLQAVEDATRPITGKNTAELIRAKRDADDWIRTGGRDFRRVCDWAGLDPDFIRGAYVQGRINREALRKSGVEVAA